MSLEVFGTSGDDGISVDELYDRGWVSDGDCEKWWREGEPETVYTFAEAAQITEDWLRNED